MADLSVTASNVVAGNNAVKKTVTAGEAITAGALVYMKTTDRKHYRADANVSSAEAVLDGIALNDAAANQPLEIMTAGDVNPGAGTTVGLGETYIVSANVGKIAPVTDVATGWFVSILGVGTTSSNIQLGINVSGVAHA